MEIALAISRQPRYLHGAKVVLALAATALFLWGWSLARKGRPEAHRALRDRLLAALGILGLLGGWNFGLAHLDHYVHWWDVTHYYFGAKYAPELGYTRLYACLTVADVQVGYGDAARKRSIRNLATNAGESTEALLANPSSCTVHFRKARWTAFLADVAWFHRKVPLSMWSQLQLDHGFNATPAWTLTGGLLANLGPASDAQLLALVLFDSALVLAALGLVVHAFGWRAAAAAAIVFGTNTAADFAWIGGSFLRLDWLALAVAAVCFLKMGRPFLAGFALSWSALLRIFPLLLGAGVGVKAAAEGPRSRWRFAAGGLLAAALLLPLSELAVRPPGGAADAGWRGFVANSRKHLGSPSANNMGMKTLLSLVPEQPFRYAPGEDAGRAWWRIHEDALRRRMPLFYLGLALFAALLVRVSLKQPDWVAVVASVGLVPFATTVSCYYYVFLLLYALLVVLGEGWGAAACALSAGIGVCSLLGSWDYEVYTAASALVLAFAALVAARLGSNQNQA